MYWIIIFLFIILLYINLNDLKIKETFNNFFSSSRVGMPYKKYVL